jgi:hypothetical protein
MVAGVIRPRDGRESGRRVARGALRLIVESDGLPWRPPGEVEKEAARQRRARLCGSSATPPRSSTADLSRDALADLAQQAVALARSTARSARGLLTRRISLASRRSHLHDPAVERRARGGDRLRRAEVRRLPPTGRSRPRTPN